MPGGINYNDPTPFYEQIERDIKRKIEAGILKPGDNIGSQTDLSREYSVSIVTVKKALSNLTLKGILFTRIGKGTYVAEPKKDQVDFSKHRTIGLVLRNIKHPFFSLISHGIEEKAYELGYNILLSGSSNKIEKEESQINHFRELGVDGLIIASLSLDYKATDYIQSLHDENFPYVMVSYIHDPHCWYVGSDQEVGGYIATEHLIKLGYKSIGYLHAGKNNLLSEVRKNGYARALSDYNIIYDSKLIFYLEQNDIVAEADRFQQGYNFGKTFRGLEKRPEALFMYTDLTALGFQQAAIEEGINIPDDIAIVGFDDVIYSRYSHVPLTTIHQPAEKIGEIAVEVIDKRINKEDVGNRTILKPSLVVRESCGAKKRTINNSRTKVINNAG